MLPPYSRGAATSRLLRLLEEGHGEVAVWREEREKVACWIDLLVPFCGDYTEANLWEPEELEKYNRFLQKRQRMEEVEKRSLSGEQIPGGGSHSTFSTGRTATAAQGRPNTCSPPVK